MRKFRILETDDFSAVAELFVSVFSESEGEQEGKAIGRLVKALLAGIDGENVCGFVAIENERIVGAIFFSRLTFDGAVEAFLLAPVAVEGTYQGMGIGKALIAHGLGEMARRGVSFVATYGDPAFYSKLGFRSISTDVIRPPYELSQPEGWLGQSLTDDSLESLSGRCTCVQVFEDPRYW